MIRPHDIEDLSDEDEEEDEDDGLRRTPEIGPVAKL